MDKSVNTEDLRGHLITPEQQLEHEFLSRSHEKSNPHVVEDAPKVIEPISPSSGHDVVLYNDTASNSSRQTLSPLFPGAQSNHSISHLHGPADAAVTVKNAPILNRYNNHRDELYTECRNGMGLLALACCTAESEDPRVEKARKDMGNETEPLRITERLEQMDLLHLTQIPMQATGTSPQKEKLNSALSSAKTAQFQGKEDTATRTPLPNKRTIDNGDTEDESGGAESRRASKKPRVVPASRPATSSTRTSAANGKPKHKRQASSASKKNDPFHEIDDYSPSLSEFVANPRIWASFTRSGAKSLVEDPHVHLLHAAERAFAESIGVTAAKYLQLKRTILQGYVQRLREDGENAKFNKTACQTLCFVDVNKASKCYEAFERMGWFKVEEGYSLGYYKERAIQNKAEWADKEYPEHDTSETKPKTAATSSGSSA